MDTRRLLAVFALVASLTCVLTRADSCGELQFECKSEQCVDLSAKCDGQKSCDDGTDEEAQMCSRVPTVNMTQGDIMEVKVQRGPDHGFILFFMCDAQTCSRMDVKGSDPEGNLWYDSYTGCDSHGTNCLYDGTYTTAESGNFSIFKAGEYVFRVQRRPSEMVLWLTENVRKTTVPTGAFGRLVVRALNWKTDMPVQFKLLHSEGPPNPISSAPASCNAREFRCGSGQCIQLLDKCSGKKECLDSSDESNALCGSVPATNMSVGDVLTVQMNVKAEYGGVGFLLCGSNTCSRLRVGGSSPDGTLAFFSYTGCNFEGVRWCREERKKLPYGWKAFASGSYVFEVQRRPSELAVWLQGHADKQAKVPVWPGSGLLRVRPHFWTSNMPVHFDGPHCGSAPLAPIALTVNGKEADLGAFPWHAAIYLKQSPSEYQYICGGSLVTRTIVISVAHCFYKDGKTQAPEKFAVALGKIFSDWDHDELTTVFKSDVNRVITHPLYRGINRNYGDDVAILQLTNTVEFSDYIQPICINEELKVSPGEKFMVVGWGGNLPKLESVTFQFQSISSCLDSITQRPHEVSYITGDKFCSLREKGVQRPPGLAKGDSGGGAVARRGDRWFLVGLVSVQLDDGKLMAFTDVSKHIEWRTRATEDALTNTTTTF